LRNLIELEKNITKYVMKNTPAGLPEVGKYIKNYIKALLESSSITDAFALLDAHFGTDIVFDNKASLSDDELMEEFEEHQRNGELLTVSFESFVFSKRFKLVDPLHFILQDFCSVVGLVYKPEYKEAILRSFVRKDLQYYYWLFSEYLGLPIAHIDVIRSGTDSEVSFTDEWVPPDSDDGILVSYTDNRVSTDLFVRGYLSMVSYFDINSITMEEVYSKLNEYKDLLSLVLPARLFLGLYFV